MTQLAVPGASCRITPSPTASALRLDGLRVQGQDALAALLERMPPPPWDAAVEASDPAATWLEAAGFTPYGRTVTVTRTADGLARPPHIPGVTVLPYRNDWADAFTEAEGQAMSGLGCFAQMGSPTGYEHGAGHGAFVVARRGEAILGFCHAQVPEGVVSWLGVVPAARRQGVGRALMHDVAAAVLAARGTHLIADVADRPDALAFFRALGFRERTRRVLLVRPA